MFSIIHGTVDETHFRFGLFLVSQTIALGALVAVALRSATGTGLSSTNAEP